MAIFAWLGWIAGGPLAPTAVLISRWNLRGSLARAHALLAVCAWATALLLGLAIDVLADPDAGDDGLLSWVPMGTLALCSVVGATLAALRRLPSGRRVDPAPTPSGG